MLCDNLFLMLQKYHPVEDEVRYENLYSGKAKIFQFINGMRNYKRNLKFSFLNSHTPVTPSRGW